MRQRQEVQEVLPSRYSPLTRVHSLQALERERRPEIRVVLTDKPYDVLSDRLWNLPVTRPASLPLDEPGRPVFAQSAAQALDLAET